jgi:phosphotriesterase-related protein
MGKQINTVLGPIEKEQLGRTLMHEHFIYGFTGFQGDTTLGPFNEKLCFSENLKWVKPITEAPYNFKTIVDATNNECGRDPIFMARLALALNINVICSTGYYYENMSAHGYWKFRSGSHDILKEIADMMKTELEVGIRGTEVFSGEPIKAGVMKLATSAGVITPIEETFFKAAAEVNKETGRPIITHTELGTMGPEQAKLLVENGANPSDISIGHMCGNTDIDYHERVLQTGVFDCFDRFGLEGELFHTPTDPERCDTIIALLNKGYEDQILMSHDSVTIELGRYDGDKNELPIFKNANIQNIPTRIIPMLLEKGATEAQIEKIFVTNPAKCLGE